MSLLSVEKAPGFYFYYYWTAPLSIMIRLKNKTDTLIISKRGINLLGNGEVWIKLLIIHFGAIWQKFEQLFNSLLYKYYNI